MGIRNDEAVDAPAIRIGMGEGMIARGSGILISEGIGSCVVVTLYDPGRKIGGIAHIMLQTNRRKHAEERRTHSESLAGEHRTLAEGRRVKTDESQVSGIDSIFRFADTAIAKLLCEMCAQGALIRDIHAKMIGGASMFECDGNTQPGIGELNITGIKEILKREGIHVLGKELGGRHGRSVRFWLDSGRVIVSTIGMKDREL